MIVDAVPAAVFTDEPGSLWLLMYDEPTNGWGRLKVAIILRALPLEEYIEYKQLAGQKHLSAEDEERMVFLRRLANALHCQQNGTAGTPESDLAVYSAEQDG